MNGLYVNEACGRLLILCETSVGLPELSGKPIRFARDGRLQRILEVVRPRKNLRIRTGVVMPVLAANHDLALARHARRSPALVRGSPEPRD